jgi:Rod binding domain-containing protein
MNSISPAQSAINSARFAADARETAGAQLVNQSPNSKDKMQSTFQDFAAGTFYKEMLKSLHKMHGKPAYVYGGRAEEIFQGQMDQQIAEEMAHSKGSSIADPLYKGYLQHVGRR